ncbi:MULTISPECIES: SDR family oxidoreductase [Enterocloster]|uniref:SDR family oxidoreductase n=1 Tax=Enterocloster TaxID=2719313 RepID=UPI000D1A12DB|nr:MULTISPECIES: SDR family oxidoreductase [Enterocloster]MBS5602963.1 SDR family oxidoreductase [Enterocloster asparagiformis]MDR3755689.1 SDR family oxidoreductase [Enterocloster sp.]PST33110.1 2-deoxy-D-gluconate 3-dehydrogenase [Enterocloster lavalensis]
MNTLFDLTGRKAIVTGAAQGLAYSMAEGLMESGAEVAVIDISDRTVEVAREFCGRGFRCHGIQADLSRIDELEGVFSRAVDALGGLDIIVNGAGVQRRYRSEEFPTEEWDFVINVNLNSVWKLCQLAGRHFLENGGGKIINIASMLSFLGGYTVAAYAASKGGVAQLTKALSNEWAGKNININALAPGYMATALNTAIINDPVRSKEILDRIPARRWGQPGDMKGAVIFLASGASDYLNGAIIPVDGGFLSR